MMVPPSQAIRKTLPLTCRTPPELTGARPTRSLQQLLVKPLLAEDLFRRKAVERKAASRRPIPNGSMQLHGIYLGLRGLPYHNFVADAQKPESYMEPLDRRLGDGGPQIQSRHRSRAPTALGDQKPFGALDIAAWGHVPSTNGPDSLLVLRAE